MRIRRNPKPEIRSPKEFRMSNSEWAGDGDWSIQHAAPITVFLDFGFRISDFYRHV
jgi:hypothetical protein